MKSKSPTPVNKFSILLGGLLSAVVLSSSAFAQHGGGGHGGGGGGHAGGGAHAVAGGHYGGGYRGGYGGGYRGGYGYGGYRGGYGYGGWRGGWGCCGWGWGWGGLGLGLYFASLPLYYDTYYWGGVPYYYADNTYYTYDPNQRQYETVAPPQGVQDQKRRQPTAAPPARRPISSPTRRTARARTSRPRTSSNAISGRRARRVLTRRKGPPRLQRTSATTTCAPKPHAWRARVFGKLAAQATAASSGSGRPNRAISPACGDRCAASGRCPRPARIR
jgi:hypothetical protein